jgi:hypothetical protein
VGQQLLGRRGRDDPPGRQAGGPAVVAVHGQELPPGLQVVVDHPTPLLRQQGLHRGGPLGIAREHPVDHLLLVAEAGQLLGGGGGIAQGLLHRHQQAGRGGRILGHQRVVAAVGLAGQGRIRRQRKPGHGGWSLSLSLGGGRCGAGLAGCPLAAAEADGEHGAGGEQAAGQQGGAKAGDGHDQAPGSGDDATGIGWCCRG